MLSKMKSNQKGQALVETVITHSILIFVIFGTIEIARLLAYKVCLQSIASDLSKQLSFSQLSLIKEGIIQKKEGTQNLEINNYNLYLSNEIKSYLSLFSTSLISFENEENPIRFLEKNNIHLSVIFINNEYLSNESPNGVFIKINSCLPVLFSGYFKNFQKENSIKIGKDLNSQENESNRDCQGKFLSSKIFAPLFWFRVRVAAYAPWPASTQIYEKGYAVSKKIIGIEQKYKDDVIKSLQEEDLALFFKDTTQEVSNNE